MIPVARPYIGEEEEREVIEAVRSGWLTQGPRVALFEEKFASYIGCEHAIAVSSCTTALQLALWACGIRPGDEVICPSLSFIASANSIACIGAKPIFCDIDLKTYNLDPLLVPDLISPRTKAIIVVHQIGLPADLNAFRKIADRNGLTLIEDAACAIGAQYEGQLIGRPIGDIACFSFHPRKIMTTGEGGMITTRDALMAERLRRLRQHAMSIPDTVRHNARQIVTEAYDEIGFNFRMTDMQAAIGIVQLGRLREMLEWRRVLAHRYNKLLSATARVLIPNVPENRKHNYQSYMIRLQSDVADRRNEIIQELLEKNISTRRAVMAIHREKPYHDGDWEDKLPQTCLASDTGIILPLYHHMTETEQDHVVEALLNAVA